MEVADYLLDQGADINSLNNEQKTPLHRAIYRGKLDSIKFLVGKGANLNVRDQDGNTALHDAAKYNYNKVARLLVDKGANLKVINYKEQTALDVAKTTKLSWEKLWTNVRNISENNNLYSDELGSVQEIIEDKLLEQASEEIQIESAKIKEANENPEVNNEENPEKLSTITQLKQFAEAYKEAIAKEETGSVMSKALLSLQEVVEKALADAYEGRLDLADDVLKALIDAREGRSYVVEVEANTAPWENPNAEPESTSSDRSLAGELKQGIIDPNAADGDAESH